MKHLNVPNVGFVVAIGISAIVPRHRVGEAARQVDRVSFSNVVFIGLPILSPLFGSASILTVAVASLVENVTLTPLTVTILECTAGLRHRPIVALAGLVSLLSDPDK